MRRSSSKEEEEEEKRRRRMSRGRRSGNIRNRRRRRRRRRNRRRRRRRHRRNRSRRRRNIQDDDTEDDGDCSYNGTVYLDTEDVPTSDPCVLCLCYSGEVRACVVPSGRENCRGFPPRDGECCPDSWECDDIDTTVPELRSEFQQSQLASAASRLMVAQLGNADRDQGLDLQLHQVLSFHSSLTTQVLVHL